jgi:hypothetical protein
MASSLGRSSLLSARSSRAAAVRRGTTGDTTNRTDRRRTRHPDLTTRCARPRIHATRSRSARRRRPPSLRRHAVDRDCGHPRHPDRDRQVATQSGCRCDARGSRGGRPRGARCERTNSVNTEIRSDRLISAWLDLEAPDSAPAGLLARINAQTRARRPRSAWLARLLGHHMGVERHRGFEVSLGRIRLAMIVLIAIAIAAALGVAVGSRPSLVVVPAPTSDRHVGPSLEPSSSDVPPVTPTPGSTRIPDALLGAWSEDVESNGFWWFFRAGDPYCLEVVRTDLDCLVRGTGTDQDYGPREQRSAAAWLDHGDLMTAWWTSNGADNYGDCSHPRKRYRLYANVAEPVQERPYVSGDLLILSGDGGLTTGCPTGSVVLHRAGTGTIPTSPPKPTP